MGAILKKRRRIEVLKYSRRVTVVGDPEKFAAVAEPLVFEIGREEHGGCQPAVEVTGRSKRLKRIKAAPPLRPWFKRQLLRLYRGARRA